MSDVIRFPRFIRSSALAVSGLTEADDMSAGFKMSDLYGKGAEGEAVEDGQSDSDTNVSFLRQSSSLPAPVTGWSNQELADLYRTQRILALAGVTTQVDDGITDEGDPWFVFMDSQDEVLVHFSRFDGAYIVTSHMQDAPIKGDSLQDLVAEFSRRVKPVTRAGQSGQNVVAITKRDRDVVFIHPAAALAALVWSIYLMSDELIAAVPIIEAGEAEDPSGSSIVGGAVGGLDAPADHVDVPTSAAQKSPSLPAIQDLAKPGASAPSSREGLILGVSGHGAKAVAASLSLVALAVGLPLPASNALEITDKDGGSQKLSMASLSAALTHVKAKEAALLMASEAVSLQQREIETTELPDESGGADAPNIETSTESSAIFEAVTPIHAAEISSFSSQLPEVSAGPMPRGEEVIQHAERIEKPTSSAGVPESSKEISFLQSFDAAFESFEIISLDKIAQTELTQLLNIEDAKNVPVPSTALENDQGIEAFDQEAREFLDFLLHTYNNIKIVNLPTEIIFIHMDAFENGRDTYEVSTKSWSFDDGGTVSTIGFKSDMAQFDLIA